MDIVEIKEKVKNDEYEISFHGEKERYAEDIALKEIETAVDNGEILEDYPDDPRGPSCLVLGHSENRPLHIVCGCAPEGSVRVITVYVPKPPKWSDERTRAKEGEKNAS